MKIFKNSLFKTTGPISTKFGTKHPWVDGTNKGQHPSSRGDNSKIIKIYGEYLKIFYLSITGPVSTKPGKKHPWVKEIQIFFLKIKSHALLQGELRVIANL